MIEILLFFAGLLITVLGATKFSKAAVQLARLLKLPKVLIGATIVSLATTAPETIVAVLSSVQNHSGLALGNALGSPVANIGLILGLVLLFGRVNFERHVFKTTLVLIILVLFSYLIAFWQKTIDFVGGILLIVAGLSYLWFLLKTEEKKEQEETTEVINFLKKISHIVQAFFKLIISLGLITFGGFLIIQGAVNFAKFLAVSEIFVGLTLVAVGTSLPEFSLAVTSIFAKNVAVSVGNLIGASVLTLTLTLGLAAIIVPVKTNPGVFLLDFPAILLMSLGFLAGQYFKTSAKIVGASFIIFYIFYLVALKIVG